MLPPGAPASVAFPAVLRACVEQIQFNRPGVLEGADPEYLHQVRVGIRRLRAALRAYRSLVRRPAGRAFERKLRALMRKLGPARDWDVLALALGALPPVAKARQARARRTAVKALEAPRLQPLLDDLLVWTEQGPWRAGADPGESAAMLGRRAVARMARRLLRSARKMDWSDERARHALRILAKRLRYACESFGTGAGLHSLVEALRPLQDALGELRDLEARRKLLQGAGLPAPARHGRRKALLSAAAGAWRRVEPVLAARPTARG